MKRPRESDQHAYFRAILEREYPHVLKPYFAGYITSISGDTGGFACRVQHIGDLLPDLHDYPVLNPAYVPVIGDLVECVWRDGAVGYVVGPLRPGVDASVLATSGAAPRFAAHASGNQAVGTGLLGTIVTLDVVDVDTHGGWQGGNAYIIPCSGSWLMIGKIWVGGQAAAGTMNAAVYRSSDAVEQIRDARDSTANNEMAVVAVAIKPLRKGDALQLRSWGTVAFTIPSSAGLQRAELELAFMP